MGRKAGLTLDDVVDAAAGIADRDGLDAATLTAVAAELGIKTPSLYNHVSGVDGLRRQLVIRGSRMLDEAFREATAGLEGIEALRAVAYVDRRFAAEHPGLYDSFLPAPTEEDDPTLYAEMAAPVLFTAGFLLEMGLHQQDAIHHIRALRALLHGFLDLEANRGFGMPIDIDASFDVAVEMVLRGIEASTGSD